MWKLNASLEFFLLKDASADLKLFQEGKCGTIRYPLTYVMFMNDQIFFDFLPKSTPIYIKDIKHCKNKSSKFTNRSKVYSLIILPCVLFED